MNELTVRVWDKIGHCWRSGMYIESNGKWGYWARNDYRDGAALRVTNHKTNLQEDIVQSLSTGLEDANKTSVFQYDVLHDSKTGEYFEVVWHTKSAGFKARPIAGKGAYKSLAALLRRGCVVVGNTLEHSLPLN